MYKKCIFSSQRSIARLLFFKAFIPTKLDVLFPLFFSCGTFRNENGLEFWEDNEEGMDNQSISTSSQTTVTTVDEWKEKLSTGCLFELLVEGVVHTDLEMTIQTLLEDVLHYVYGL